MNLHLGCGPIKLPGFVNIDYEQSHQPDMCLDYTKMPRFFERNSVDNIYTCHSIEHLVYPDGVLDFFGGAHYVLKPGGCLRIVVPDLAKVARKYVSGESLQDIYEGPYYKYRDLPAERFLYFMRGWEHQIVFDAQLLATFFGDLDHQFQHVRTEAFNHSRVPEMCGIDRFQSESLCMEGVK